MAEPTLAELFDTSRSDTITHRGRVVRAVVHLPVPDGAVVQIQRTNVEGSRPQALKLALRKGVFDVNGHRAPEIALWSTTSPDLVEITVRGGGPTTLDVWNAWIMGGVDCCWIGNAGIVSRSTEDGQVLQCSDGVGQASFSDLVVTVRVIS